MGNRVARRRQAYVDAGATPEELDRIFPPVASTSRGGGAAEARMYMSLALTDAWSNLFASLPPLNDLPYAVLLARRPAGTPRRPVGVDRFDHAKIEAQLRDDDDANPMRLVAGSPHHLLIVSTSSGHYIHRDEPALTLLAFRRIVEFAREIAAKKTGGSADARD